MKRPHAILAAIASAAALVVAAPATAGDDHKHSHGTDKVHAHGHDHDHAKAATARHGGAIADTGHHLLELVAKDGNLELYIQHEDGEGEDAAGSKATATVLSGGKKTEVALAPAEGNVMKGSGAFTAGKGMVVVVTLTVPGHDPEQARFKFD